MKAPKTPCIGICSTTSLGDPVCRGCRRFSFEVIKWNSYGPQEKKAVLKRIEKLVSQIFENKFHIQSEKTLQLELKRLNVPFDPELSPYCWLHNLFKKRKDLIQNLSEYGVSVHKEFSNVPCDQLIAEVDSELQILSSAHLQRYFKVPS